MRDLREVVIQREMAKSKFRGKINAKCVECIYDSQGGSGTWRQQVAACTSYNCPLFDVRPMPSEVGENADLRVVFSEEQDDPRPTHRDEEKDRIGVAKWAGKA